MSNHAEADHTSGMLGLWGIAVAVGGFALLLIDATIGVLAIPAGLALIAVSMANSSSPRSR